MDPFGICLALSLFGAGLWSSSKKGEAAEEYNRAASSYRQSRTQLISAAELSKKQLHILAINRLSCVAWQVPELRKAASRLGIADRFFARGTGVFGGRTLEQVLDFLRASRNTLVTPAGIFDKGVMLSSGAALLVEGVQHLDKIGFLPVPALHSSLHDVVASLPADHAHGVADALGGIGAAPVGEVLSGGLVIFSAFRSVYNLFRADALNGQASTLWSEANSLDRSTRTIRAIGSRADSLSSDLEEASYRAFKWAMIAEAAADLRRRDRSWAIPRAIADRLSQAAVALWSNLQQPASA